MTIQAQKYTFTVPANQSARLLVAGAFFRIISAMGSVTVQNETCNLQGLGVGDGMGSNPFGWLNFTDSSGAANTVSVVISDKDFLNSPITSTTITATKAPVSASFANTAKTVTNATAQLIAANANRQYLLIQNKDAAGNLYINFGAGAATLANGLLIPPGGAWEWNGTVSNQAVQAIGDAASNANIVVIEG